MVVNGVREFIVDGFRGRPICGSVQRAYNEQDGQYLIVNAAGSLESLQRLENDLFSAEVTHWVDWTEIKCEGRARLPQNREFTILNSQRYAKCGENSNPKYDYQLVSASSASNSTGAKSVKSSKSASNTRLPSLKISSS